MTPPRGPMYRGTPMAPNPAYELPGLPGPRPTAPVAPPLTFSLPAGMTTATFAAQAAPGARKVAKSVVGPVLMLLLGKVLEKLFQALLEYAFGLLQGKGANKPGDPMAGRYLPEVAAVIEGDRNE